MRLVILLGVAFVCLAGCASSKKMMKNCHAVGVNTAGQVLSECENL